MLTSRRSGGFSLIEALIVIVIAAVLMGMLTVGLGGTEESASAARLIQSVKTLKSAYIAYYADTHQYLPLTDVAGAGRNSAWVTSLDPYVGETMRERMRDDIDAFGSLLIWPRSGTSEGGGVLIGYMGGDSIRNRQGKKLDGERYTKLYDELMQRDEAVGLVPVVMDGPLLMRVR